MIPKKIAIIGSGNIGSAFVTGLLREGSHSASDLCLSDISQEALAPFAAKGVRTVQNNVEAVKDANVVVLCVKPYLVCDVIDEIFTSLTAETLLVSFAAGVTLDKLIEVTDYEQPLFRVIPNTAMSVCASATCISASARVSKAQKDVIIELFSRVGKVYFISESAMDAVTVIASCGTAFAMRYLRAAMTGGVEIGLRPEIAKKLVAQTMMGAATLIRESDSHPEAEIDKVATPKGITIKGLNEMEHAGFSSAVMQGIRAAYGKLNQ
jgi:pyrroline-5-carboxylate reductase